MGILLDFEVLYSSQFQIQLVNCKPAPGPLVVPIFGTLSRIRDIWVNCPDFVPILDFLPKYKGYLLPCEKIGTAFFCVENS